MRTYKGEAVQFVRRARSGDNGFKDDGSQQVLVRMGDNTKRAVPRADVVIGEAVVPVTTTPAKPAAPAMGGPFRK